MTGSRTRTSVTLGAALFFVLTAGPSTAAERARRGPSWDLGHGELMVSRDRRFLLHADGTPFLYLGDTAWELFHRLKREEAARYLENRRQKGFTVVQAVALAELDGLRVPNAYGHRPLVENDPARPDVTPGPANDYWDHVDFVIATAAEKGISIGFLPTWGDKVGPATSGKGPAVFDEASARAYGRFLGERYRSASNILWILGGDRPPLTPEGDYRSIWRAMAAGIKEGDEGRHLITYHPGGETSSSGFLHDETWLAFNMIQSGHGAKDAPNHDRIAADFNLSPPKPVLDGEPRYEDHPVNWDPKNGWFDDVDVRQAAYWALFAGAFGHTYGCHDIWQMYAPGRAPVSSARTPWRDALDLPGAWDMLHVRRLLLSRPFLRRVPDPAFVTGGQGLGADHVQAARDPSGSYAFVYVPTGKPVTVDLRRIAGPTARAWWFDPRTGAASAIGDFRTGKHREFTPPGQPARGNDWVLVVDAAGQGFPPPGRVE